MKQWCPLYVFLYSFLDFNRISHSNLCLEFWNYICSIHRQTYSWKVLLKGRQQTGHVTAISQAQFILPFKWIRVSQESVSVCHNLYPFILIPSSTIFRTVRSLWCRIIFGNSMRCVFLNKWLHPMIQCKYRCWIPRPVAMQLTSIIMASLWYIRFYICEYVNYGEKWKWNSWSSNLFC